MMVNVIVMVIIKINQIVHPSDLQSLDQGLSEYENKLSSNIGNVDVIMREFTTFSMPNGLIEKFQ